LYLLKVMGSRQLRRLGLIKYYLGKDSFSTTCKRFFLNPES